MRTLIFFHPYTKGNAMPRLASWAYIPLLKELPEDDTPVLKHVGV